MRRRESWQGSVVEFCCRKGVSQAAFYQWRKKLRTGPVARKNSGTGSQPAFVTVSPVTRNALRADPSFAGAVVVTLANGVRVEIPAADPALVERRVRLLIQSRRHPAHAGVWCTAGRVSSRTPIWESTVE